MRKLPLESRVRENRTHGSEGGDGESRSHPYQAKSDWIISLGLGAMTMTVR